MPLRGNIGTLVNWPYRNLQPYPVALTRLAGNHASVNSRRIMLAINDPNHVVDETVLKCNKALGLTPGESCLALALVKGATIAEHATLRQVSIHTVRSQLRSIHMRLGLSRQSQLVAWLRRSAVVGVPPPLPVAA